MQSNNVFHNNNSIHSFFVSVYVPFLFNLNCSIRIATSFLLIHEFKKLLKSRKKILYQFFHNEIFIKCMHDKINKKSYKSITKTCPCPFYFISLLLASQSLVSFYLYLFPFLAHTNMQSRLISSYKTANILGFYNIFT